MNNISVGKDHKIIYLIPAGRRRYLKILFNYLNKDKFIDEIWIFDNCRNEEDRDYIQAFFDKIKQTDKRWKLFRIEGADGTNRSVNKIYNYMKSYEEKAFFIKIDDDIVYMDENFSEKFYKNSLSNIDRCYLFSPIVINNALISFLLIMEGKVQFYANGFSAQASDTTLWKSALFAEYIHKVFLSYLKKGESYRLYLNKQYQLSLQRFSINCIGIFSETIHDIEAKGIEFVPNDADDEEYLTSILSAKLDKSVCIVNNCLVSHFSFYPQEKYLLKYTDLLKNYAKLVGVELTKDDLVINRIEIGKLFQHFKNCLVDFVNYNLGIYIEKQKLRYRKLLEEIEK